MSPRAEGKASLRGSLSLVLLLGLALGGCDLFGPEDDAVDDALAMAPASLAGKTMVFATIELVFSSSTVRDPAGSDVPYSYKRNGESSATFTMKNSEVYSNLTDATYSLRFTSASAGEISIAGETTSFKLTG